MPKFMPTGVDVFYEVIDPKADYLYVDKSLWIKEVIDDPNKVILITRPRRWGKTLNLSMLQHFLAPQVINRSTQGMFNGLQIAYVEKGRYIQHQGRYPVILLNLKDVKESNLSAVLRKIRLEIRKCYNEHIYLKESKYLSAGDKEIYDKFYLLKNPPTQEELQSSLFLLTQLLYAHHKQPVYILIDEYDTPLIHASTYGVLQEVTDFFKPFFGEALKSNPYLQKGVMTGILRIAKENMLSDLNNLESYSVLEPNFQQYFGFTEVEVEELFQKAGLERNIPRVKQLYNGYQVGETTLYNPWSIASCVNHKGVLKPYWVKTASDSTLKTALLNYHSTIEMKIKFEQLLAGHTITGMINERVSFEDVERGDEPAIWSLLLFAGYLKVVAVSESLMQDYYSCQLSLPNEEVAGLYRTTFKQWLVGTKNREITRYNKLLHSIIYGDVEAFTKSIHDFLLQSSSVYDYGQQPEAYYQGFMSALTAGLSETHIIESNPESGHGRPDMLYIPKDSKQPLAIILEFKIADSRLKQTVDEMATLALKQIITNGYEAKLRQYPHIQEVLKVGIGFGKKSVCAAYAVESVTVVANFEKKIKLTTVYGMKPQ